MKICWAGTSKENHCPSVFLLSSKINFKNPHAPREACAFDMAYMKIVNDMYDSIKGLCESWIAIIKNNFACAVFSFDSATFFRASFCHLFTCFPIFIAEIPPFYACSLNLSKEFEQKRVVRKMFCKLAFFRMP